MGRHRRIQRYARYVCPLVQLMRVEFQLAGLDVPRVMDREKVSHPGENFTLLIQRHILDGFPHRQSRRGRRRDPCSSRPVSRDWPCRDEGQRGNLVLLPVVSVYLNNLLTPVHPSVYLTLLADIRYQWQTESRS